jgi:hypothetical protein
MAGRSDAAAGVANVLATLATASTISVGAAAGVVVVGPVGVAAGKRNMGS